MKFINRILDLKNKLKEKLGINNAEISIVFILLIGLLIGGIYQNFFTDLEYNLTEKDELFFVLDSLAEVNKTTYIGSDSNDEPIPELEKKDTIVKQKYKPSKLNFKGVVNINSASSRQLQKLYKIGEKTAQRIIEYRKQNPFKTKEEIMNVRGIGKATYEKIKNNIEV